MDLVRRQDCHRAVEVLIGADLMASRTVPDGSKDIKSMQIEGLGA